MQLEDYFDFFENPNAIRIKGHRIGLEHIVERFNDGYSAEMIVHELPSLSLEQAYAAITYYLHNKPQVDEYMAAIDRYVEEQVRLQESRHDPLLERMREVTRRYRQEGRIA